MCWDIIRRHDPNYVAGFSGLTHNDKKSPAGEFRRRGIFSDFHKSASDLKIDLETLAPLAGEKRRSLVVSNDLLCFGIPFDLPTQPRGNR